jgi:hypothetical protein
MIKFYGALALDETLVSIVRNKPVSLKNSLVEELRKVEADASLTGDPVYYSIKSEKPLTINVEGEETEISKEDLINKIKTENYRLSENVEDDTDPTKIDITNDDDNKGLADKLNDDLSTKHIRSRQRIEPQDEQPVINFYQYWYSAFSMETSVEVDDKGNIMLING